MCEQVFLVGFGNFMSVEYIPFKPLKEKRHTGSLNPMIYINDNIIGVPKSMGILIPPTTRRWSKARIVDFVLLHERSKEKKITRSIQEVFFLRIQISCINTFANKHYL
eukprot:GHVU01099154.1.p2 GENE.GHVU01099154.1~~GHVU01099154.1.p2  ORF type:complete len:108 (-),score=11.51 GHVU01099154.1:574-897(-)